MLPNGVVVISQEHAADPRHVSGPVILFERPVKVGDAVQIGDVQGDVRRIGIRSSTVRTYEGADVIVPNSALVAEKVTNWTPADHQRRLWCVAWFGGDGA